MKYTKKDFRMISWDEYGSTLELLNKKLARLLKKENLSVDTVVPIFRGGSFPATFLAYKLRILNIQPVQFKYVVNNGALQLIKLSTPKSNAHARVVLVVENNQCFGNTAQRVAKEVRKKFPNATVIYAAAYMDYSHQHVSGADYSVYGVLTNETGTLSNDDAVARHIDCRLGLFPWESMEEELSIINGKEYKYFI